jgi:hypothetical protein
MIIYLIDPKTGRDNTNKPVELPDNVLRQFGGTTEIIEHDNITYYRSINYSIMSPYGWSIMNDEYKEIRNQA